MDAVTEEKSSINFKTQRSRLEMKRIGLNRATCRADGRAGYCTGSGTPLRRSMPEHLSQIDYSIRKKRGASRSIALVSLAETHRKGRSVPSST